MTITNGKLNEWLPFEKAREIVRSLGLKNQVEYRKYAEEKGLSEGIPKHPDRIYKNKGWKGWGDWLGTGRIANQDFKPLHIEEAKKIIQLLGIKSKKEFYKYAEEKGLSEGITTHPERTYKNKGWKGWGDFCGTGTKWTGEGGWSIQKVKELLRDLIESKVIDTFTEVRLYDLLYSKGVLNLDFENRHRLFFNNLIEAIRTEEGKKAIEDYAYSEEENPPDLSNIEELEGEEIQTAKSPEELAKFVEESSDPLDHGKINTPEQILKQTEFLESICVDEEKMQFQVNCSVQDLWKNTFEDEINTVNKVARKDLD